MLKYCSSYEYIRANNETESSCGMSPDKIAAATTVHAALAASMLHTQTSRTRLSTSSASIVCAASPTYNTVYNSIMLQLYQLPVQEFVAVKLLLCTAQQKAEV